MDNLVKGIEWQLKPVEKYERANLPDMIRLIYFWTLTEYPISIKLVEEARAKYPQYFVPVGKHQSIEEL